MTDALICWRGEVQAEWTDYNGHLRDAFYLLIFSLAGDALMARLGLDEAGRERLGHSLFTVEAHLNYLNELHQGEAVEVRVQLLGHDAKRLQPFFSLHRAGESAAAACSEQLWLNIDMSIRRAAPFAAPVAEQLAALASSQADLPLPELAGRRIALPAPRKH